jgi:alpha-D-xyloside xylohydrolase
MLQIYPGIWKVTVGQPELATPVRLRGRAPVEDALRRMCAPPDSPLGDASIAGDVSTRGCVIRLPLGEDEQLYGLGLQLLSFNQRDLKKTARVNSDPRVDLGDSHAPVPFYVSTAGYGVLVDTARYATFYLGSARARKDRRGETAQSEATVIFTAQDLAETRREDRDGCVAIEVPYAQGVDVYIFAGPDLKAAVERYNLFSGGGCIPPRWGLGVWYRCRADFDQPAALGLVDDLRRDGMPCDVLGLEPGWQTHSYSCSFVWSRKFPDPRRLAGDLAERGCRLNLWTHAFVHPSSPIYEQILPLSGDHEVWQGLVPDLALPEARQVMGDFFEQQHIGQGASGYKLDECDNSDFIVPRWSFPEISRFPSGLDGEQMHSLFGLGFQRMVDDVFRRRNQRAYHEVRSSHALAAPYPFVLYSDLYDHRDFIRGLVNCGFSGLLWCPEVRHAASAEELVRRLQVAALSPQALINAWYIKNPPWKQWVTEDNNADRFAEDRAQVEAVCRRILQLRMQLVPYLCAAFYAYHQRGTPPFRALVMDYPDDRNTWKIDDAYLMGDRILVAPVVAGQRQRDVYLPAGEWHDLWTGDLHQGGVVARRDAPLDIVPMYVKSGAILPLAIPTAHTSDPASLHLRARVYGDGSLPITLYEDDGATHDCERGAYNRLTLTWDPVAHRGAAERDGVLDCPRYDVVAWQTDGF